LEVGGEGEWSFKSTCFTLLLFLSPTKDPVYFYFLASFAGEEVKLMKEGLCFPFSFIYKSKIVFIKNIYRYIYFLNKNVLSYFTFSSAKKKKKKDTRS
jgi:hypothetical protein